MKRLLEEKMTAEADAPLLWAVLARLHERHGKAQERAQAAGAAQAATAAAAAEGAGASVLRAVMPFQVSFTSLLELRIQAWGHPVLTGPRCRSCCVEATIRLEPVECQIQIWS
eukprot:5300466-Pleurochrysis_carterae.AAC.1